MRLIDVEKEINEIELVLAEKRAVGFDENNIAFFALTKFVEKLKSVPTVNAEPMRRGQWIERGEYRFECSNCGRIEVFESPYCRECGAKMDGEENEK